MEFNLIESNWNKLKPRCKEEWGRLSEDDLNAIAGRRERLAARIRQRYGLSGDAAERQIQAFEGRNATWRGREAA